MITFMNFIISLYGLFKLAQEKMGEQKMSDFISSLDSAVKKAKEAKTDEDKLDATSDLVAILKRLG